jgi:hypothetical protein
VKAKKPAVLGMQMVAYILLCTGKTNDRVWVEVTDGKKAALFLLLVERAAHFPLKHTGYRLPCPVQCPDDIYARMMDW